MIIIGGEPAVCVVHDLDENGDVLVPEAHLHDPDQWPHLYEETIREQMFPTAVAAEEFESADPSDLGEHRRLHQRWAATRVTVSRG